MSPDTLARKLSQKTRSVRVIFMGSYIPRECGIATFTKDLTSSINILNPYSLAEIMAIDEPGGETREYPWEVKYRIHEDDKESYDHAAHYLNQSSAEIIVIEHEFGLFGDKDGEYIINFMKKIKKPIITTLHTVLEQPGENRLKIIKEIARLSSAVVVMIDIAAERLQSIYKIPSNKILVIPHGVPDIPYGPTDSFKESLGFKDNMIISTFGLLNPGKGVEYMIKALPQIIKKIPNVKFLILGATHPTLLKRDGEVYRDSLKKLINDLNLKKYVHLENRYLSLDEVIKYLRATDVYVTPYLEPQQITSGTLAYAVGAGRPCISTEYLYAKEVLSKGRGMIVPLRNEDKLAEAAIELLENNDERKEMSKRAYLYGRTMIWSKVALQYLDLFDLIRKYSSGQVGEARKKYGV